MRRNNKSKKTGRNLAILAFLLLISGAIGYGAFGYFYQSNPNPNNNTESAKVVPAEEEKPDISTCVADLPASLKFNQKIMVAAYSDQVSQLVPILSSYNIGGIIVMDEISAEQLAKLRQASPVTLIIAVDQEGGTVQRYQTPGRLPGASEMVAKSANQAYDLYQKDSQYLASLGITTNFAPVVDVISKTPSPLPDRMYSSDPNVVTTYAGSAIKAMQSADIQPVIKHFPGMGSASGNTDFTNATTDPLSILENRDLKPYQELASDNVDVMVGNMIVPGLTDGQPAVWSPDAVKMLRGLGYDSSVVYSDSLTAKAVPGKLENAAVRAWLADVDIALIVQTREQITNLASYIEAIDSLADSKLSSGEIDPSLINKSIERVLSRKKIDACEVKP